MLLLPTVKTTSTVPLYLKATFLRKFLLFVICFLSINSAFSTHLTGGLLSYEPLGNLKYLVKLNLYRDASGAILLDKETVGVYDSQSKNLITTLEVNKVSSNTIESTIDQPCVKSPAGLSYEYAIYEGILDLSGDPINATVILSFLRCCRNGSGPSGIVNILSADATGIALTTQIPNPGAYPNNNSPVFKKRAPTFICNAAPFNWDFSATDADGDSISYSLCAPITPPDQTAQPSYTSVYILPQQVSFKSPYTAANPLGGTVPLTINPVTGQLNVTTNVSGGFVFAICMNEYRNGQLIATYNRDVQVYVTNCPYVVSTTPPEIFSDSIKISGSTSSNNSICSKSLSVFFKNKSVGNGSYFWDFGDSTTSTDPDPSHTYRTGGVKKITLIASAPDLANCSDTTQFDFTLVPSPQPFVSVDTAKMRCSARILFIDQSPKPAGVSYSYIWYFGDGKTSTEAQPTHLYTTGNYLVSVSVSAAGGQCKGSYSFNVSPKEGPEAYAGRDTILCSGGTAKIGSPGNTGKYVYNWSPPTGLTSPDQPTTNAAPAEATTYTLEVSDPNSSCKNTSTVFVNIRNLGDAGQDKPVCDGDSVQIGPSGNISAGVNYSWATTGNPNFSNQAKPKVAPKSTSTFYVTISDTQAGCKVYDNVVVSVGSRPPVDAGQGAVLYYNNPVQIGSDNYNLSKYSYQWVPSTGLQNSKSPVTQLNAKFSSYYVLIATDLQSGCENRDSLRVKVICGDRDIFVPNAFSPNADDLNDTIKIEGHGDNLKIFNYTIYDRWGTPVFKGSELNKGWDGKFNGVPVEAGIYVFRLEIVCKDGDKFTKSGNITLIR